MEKEWTSLYRKFRNLGYCTSGQCLEMVEEVHKQLDADRLAQFIRQVDGKHNMGAGQLAEQIVEFLKRELQ